MSRGPRRVTCAAASIAEASRQAAAAPMGLLIGCFHEQTWALGKGSGELARPSGCWGWLLSLGSLKGKSCQPNPAWGWGGSCMEGFGRECALRETAARHSA